MPHTQETLKPGGPYDIIVPRLALSPVPNPGQSMQVALIANTAWLDEELATLHHLVVGLLDESIRVIQVLPRGRAEGEVVSFGTRLSWRETRSRRRSRRSVSRLADSLQGADLLHALDGRLWRPALDLGRELQRPVVLSANSGMDISVASRCASRLVPGQVSVVCATQPLVEQVREAVGPSIPVRFVPPGVHLGSLAERGDDETPCVVVSGDGGCDEHMIALLEGAKHAISLRSDLQLFFDGQRQDPHKLWRAIHRAGLLTNATLIPRRLGHREVLLRAGALAHPQPMGRARSLTLRAMGHAVPVMGCADPVLDYLIDGQTARVLESPTPEAWAKALVGFATKPAVWRGLGKSAQKWVGEHRLAASQLDGLIQTYRDLTGEPIAFPGPAAAAV